MARLSIFHPAGRFGTKTNPFGKDVANLELFQALARHGGLDILDILTAHDGDQGEIERALLDGAAGAAIAPGSILSTAAPRASGVLLRGQPYLEEMAWMRRQAGDDAAWSLIGLIHTLAPPALRGSIARAVTAPVHPWDALICTSPSVQSATRALLEDWGASLVERFGGRAPPLPALPLIPLGVHADRIAAQADRPGARATLRAELGLGEDDILVLWVGRLSFFEKAFPQAMLRALERAAAQSGAKVAFAMVGWFPRPDDRGLYLEAAAACAPSVALHQLDGNDRGRIADLWAGSDVFLSLVDNIQETFGITPLEAMAAGLPVVASDWDGYRYTVRDGRDGYLIPTLGGPTSGGTGSAMGLRHALELDSYQTYVGEVAQHTAVHIGRAAEALAALFASKDLRRRMGASGRARVRETFDWPVIARQVTALAAGLGEMRAAVGVQVSSRRGDPVRGDPFMDFAGFATQTLGLDTRLALSAGVQPDDVLATEAVRLDKVFSGWRSGVGSCREALVLLQAQGPMTVRDILANFPVAERRRMELALAWMAKTGLVDWLAA
ncbi:glycosyltransferase family 4 protein [Phenylobacterium immobile]|uniref:glycosyltransferase family 4 protein n=1 Tax=Phenylobacterium immobile TaxID=21 RepID=UPI000ABE79CF|nr:glycosyltransferase family 4 protein [Phenylobacterium immobile]